MLGKYSDRAPSEPWWIFFECKNAGQMRWVTLVTRALGELSQGTAEIQASLTTWCGFVSKKKKNHGEFKPYCY